ncbi:FecR family protein [uncultured Propionivibrio sp.]|uniref:FecR family protein n=1 Tax=uncultured Propionivibrio sp. TaxID=426737 RepID=UPI0029BFB29B|nr:FecR family protein [uncultured Propionivibrio sp.]
MTISVPTIMPTRRNRHLPDGIPSLLNAFVLVLLLTTTAAFADTAGRIVTSSAPATVVSAGTSRAALPGMTVESGDQLVTGTQGRITVRFSDESVVQLNADSEFRIDQYAFTGGRSDDDKGFFSLVKGGFRTVTGLLGKINRGTYRVTTQAATIGIRGTEYSARLDNGLHVQVDRGEISLTNRAGAFAVGEGQRAYVANRQSAPKYLNLGGGSAQFGGGGRSGGGGGGTSIQGNTTINAAAKDMGATAVGQDNAATNAVGSIGGK